MRVKACGITNADDAELAAGLGAWAVGLVFYPGSPRRCDPAAAAEIGALLKRRCEVVGVFVNAPLDEVVGRAEDAGLTMLQLHGDEGPAYCSEARRRSGCTVMKAARMRTAASLLGLQAFEADLFLLDAHHEELLGGAGVTFDWELLGEHRLKSPLVLSGGLTPENVAAGIEAVRPYAVDTASGTEAAPGRKDPERLRAFFESANAAGRALEAAQP